MDYKTLSIDELVQEVNVMLRQGKSLKVIEKEWGLRNKYISDKVKGKYKLDKELKQYIAKDEVVTEVVTGIVTEESKEIQVFSDDEVKIIKQMIEEYKVKQKLQESNEAVEDKTELANRNIRVYTKQYNKFANWCKENNVTQAEALYKAINMIMDM